MAESIKLLKTIEQFISNKFSHKKEKNISFEINYHSLGEKNLPILYDNNYFIPCLITKKNELEELNKNKNDSHLLIKDSKLELIFYKDDKELNIIKCCIIFIINDFSIVSNKKDEENVINFDNEKISDINKENRAIKKLRKLLYDYIKKNSNKGDKNFSLNKLFLENANNNIKIFNNDNNVKIEEINDIKNLDSEIRMREGKNLDIILDELYPEFKEELIGKYIYEMPDEIVNLQKKYKKINFNNEIYKKYKDEMNNKGKDKEIEEEKK